MSVADLLAGKLDELQELGRDGWEAVNLATYSGTVRGFGYCLVLLKRPLKD